MRHQQQTVFDVREDDCVVKRYVWRDIDLGVDWHRNCVDSEPARMALRMQLGCHLFEVLCKRHVRWNEVGVEVAAVADGDQ